MMGNQLLSMEMALLYQGILHGFGETGIGLEMEKCLGIVFSDVNFSGYGVCIPVNGKEMLDRYSDMRKQKNEAIEEMINHRLDKIMADTKHFHMMASGSGFAWFKNCDGMDHRTTIVSLPALEILKEVFEEKGEAKNNRQIMKYIYTTWKSTIDTTIEFVVERQHVLMALRDAELFSEEDCHTCIQKGFLSYFNGTLLETVKIMHRCGNSQCNLASWKNMPCNKYNIRLKFCACRKVMYCSSECQRQDWKRHKCKCCWIKTDKI